MRTINDLAALIAHHQSECGIARSALDRLWLIRGEAPTMRVPAVYEASLCLIAQGAKRVSMGDVDLVYDASTHLIVSLDLPLTGQVIEASVDRPYLCCKIDIDLAALADVAIGCPDAGRGEQRPVMAAYRSDPDLIDAACRLVGLLDRPDDAAMLAPLIEREILYRLLSGPHGATLRALVAGESHLRQIARAIAMIRERFDQRLSIDAIASAASMSASSLHAHFRAITRMSPIEYQKQLRLQEARRLMIGEGRSAGAAAFAVGYDSPSQFSREYRRLFGAPPRADVDRMRGSDAAMAL